MRHALFLFIVKALLLTVTPSTALAVPASPDIHALKQPDGTIIQARQWGNERSHGWETIDGYSIAFDSSRRKWTYAVQDRDGRLVPSFREVRKGVRPRDIKKRLRPSAVSFITGSIPGVSSPAGTAGAAPSSGMGNIPVILINFNNTTTTYNAPDFTALLFGTGNKSMKDYYEEVSYGAFSVSAGPEGVAGWYTAANTHDYYGTNSNGSDSWPGTLVREAVAAADAAFNFAPYDQNGDCYVDTVSIVHQGGGEESGGSTNIWSHSWDLNSAFAAGRSDGGTYTTNDVCPGGGFIKISDYIIQPESARGQLMTVGVFVHEYAHALGLPDLYDTDSSSRGIGKWGVMAFGSWNGVSRSGDTPAHMCAWSKTELGWVVPYQVSGDLIDETVTQAATSADIYRYGSGNQYFLLENRQRTGFDAALPGSGILIWHIDELVATNNNECSPPGNCRFTHYKVSLEQADGLWDLENDSDYGDSGDPFPGSTGNIAFTDTSIPDSSYYNGNASGFNVTSISPSGASMTVTISACVDNDGDRYGSPGSDSCVNGPANDCNDNVAAINPATFWYADADSDSYGDAGVWVQQCGQPAGYVLDNTDCDDADGSVHAVAFWYEDADGDGHGNPLVWVQQCSQPAGYVLDNTDCDDTNGTIRGPLTWYEDSDGDGYGNVGATLMQCTQPSGYVLNGTDCDDTDAAVNPELFWYVDFDQDGFGDPSQSVQQCMQPAGYVANSDDCNDTDASVTLAATWYLDADGDTFGNPALSVQMCSQPTGHVSNNSDCDDSDANIYPDGPTVRILGDPQTYFFALSGAFDAAVTGDVIQSLAVPFSAELTIERSDSITLRGGYGCDYTSVTGFSTISGFITILNGTLTLENVILQ